MSNNKQSSVEWLVEQIKKDINLRLRGFDIDKALEQAKAMHKQEIIIARSTGLPIEDGVFTAIDKAHKYYNETFGGNDEQAMIDYNKMEEEWEMDNYNEIKDEQQ
jgi:hypothetical protein